MELSTADATLSDGAATSTEAVSIISMHDFLDFLKLTCQVNEQLEEDMADGQSKIDYNVLANNPLINSLTPKNPSAAESNGSLHRQNAVSLGASTSVDKKGEYFVVNFGHNKIIRNIYCRKEKNISTIQRSR